MIVHEAEAHQVQLGRTRASPSLGARIADAAAGIDRTLAANGASRKKKGLGQAGLASSARPHKRDRARAI
jgi:hypothetical protein